MLRMRSPGSSPVGHPCISPHGSHLLHSGTVVGKELQKKKKTSWVLALPRLQQESESRQSSQGFQQTAQTQLELLEKLTAGRQKDTGQTTIAKQLTNKVAVETEDEEVTVALGKKVALEYDDLTISQKRNIRRQKYLDQVSQRNDAPFFATVALLVILPPAIILGIAVATGYVDLLP